MQRTAPPKIAFLADGFINWTGGVDFLRQCIGGIGSVLPDRTWPVLMPTATARKRMFSAAVTTKRWLWSLAGEKPAMDAVVPVGQVRDAIISTGFGIEMLSYHANPKGLERALREIDAQVVLPCYSSPGPRFPLKWIAYYADLQHKRLPGNFTMRERLKRDWELGTLLAEASAVIVPSRSVVRDIKEFYPKCTATLFGLPFCPLANPDFLADIPDNELRPYELPQKFFIISNQFWVHKSHQTAFDALDLVRKAGFADVHIFCTGNTYDFRAPGHFELLKAGVAQAGLADRIHFLGIVPKRHQLAIMRRSVALLQPTLFEGAPGGLATCDAVSTATPAIVSDIDVNREVDLGVIEFFRAGSAEDLAEKMLAALKNPHVRLSAEATLLMLRQRQQELGKMLLDAISLVSRSSIGTPNNHA